MRQINYPLSHNIAKPGLLYGGFGNKHRVSTYVNPSTLQRDQFTITVQNGAVYSITANGVVISDTSDGNATADEIQQMLLAKAAANPNFTAIYNIAENATDTLIDGSAATKDVTVTLAVSANLARASVSPGSVNLPFGRVVVDSGSAGSTAGGLKLLRKAALPSGSSDNVIGVTILNHAVTIPAYTRPQSDDPSGFNVPAIGYPPGDPVSVCMEGYIWVECENDISAVVKPYARFTTGSGGSVTGRLRTTADSNTAILCDNFRVRDYRADLQLALIHVMG